MTTVEPHLSTDVLEFAATAARDAETAYRVFHETGTVRGSGTVNFVERVPGQDLAVQLNPPGPWSTETAIEPVIATFDGQILSGRGHAAFVPTFGRVFRERPEITSAVHVHSPWLGGWAQTHQPLPIRYAASQRLTLSRQIYPHLDRSVNAGDFILEKLQIDPDLVAIFEANGGSHVIGRSGLITLAKFVVLLEEGANYQAIGDTLGGSQEFDETNLVEQWSRTGLLEEARTRGLVSR
ncbi:MULTISPECIES: class II aldolase/adducin family protein [unclassified Dietzia]|uniref:class II aldolase/adducin family protein n=1 Tax=unclassified Dietzia TaxID=2617939 RepID=UPI0015F8F10C|nr:MULTISPECIES: class II aldolase/adducin family protein [unclassified Dietzia]MBB1022913.1 class II aldolase/adducin family protein [Dietzia sp. DQ12-76]MBB1027418.1 class II aldolase/adducin family protein [Dietzia sp. DQ11-38-2]